MEPRTVLFTSPFGGQMTIICDDIHLDSETNVLKLYNVHSVHNGKHRNVTEVCIIDNDNNMVIGNIHTRNACFKVN